MFILFICEAKFLLWQAAEPSDRKSREKAPGKTENVTALRIMLMFRV